MIIAIILFGFLGAIALICTMAVIGLILRVTRYLSRPKSALHQQHAQVRKSWRQSFDDARRAQALKTLDKLGSTLSDKPIPWWNGGQHQHENLRKQAIKTLERLEKADDVAGVSK